MIEPLTSKCPNCGHINRASALNCEDCHINLEWAQANPFLLNPQEKSEPKMDSPRAPSLLIREISIRLQKNRGPITFMTFLALLVLFIAKPIWGFSVLMALFFAAWLWSMLIQPGRQKTELEKIWSELGDATGLTYLPRKPSSSVWSGPFPGLSGEYRGVTVSIEFTMEGGGGENDAPIGLTKITLWVRNPGRFSLEIMDRKIFRWPGKSEVLSWDKEFDRRFRVRGTPKQFVRQALRLAGLKTIFLLDKTHSKVLKNPYAFSWSSYCAPYILLKGSDLICLTHGVYMLVQAQVEVLNVLCDLARRIDRMGKEFADSTGLKQ